MTDSSSANERPANMWEELNKPKPREDAPAPQEEDDDRRGVPLAGIVGGAIAVAAVAVAGFIVMGGGDPSVDTSSELALVEDEDPVVVDDLMADDEDPVDGTGDGGDDAATADAATDDAATDDAATDNAGADGGDDTGAGDAYSPAVPAGADDDYVVLSRGKLYLRGEMPTQLHVAGVVSALEDLMGEGNVVSEYVVNPEAEFEMGSAADVYIEDTVLFAFASAEIAPDFYPLLGLGVTLMQLQEDVTIEFYGHTDSAGSDETNLVLSQARVDAVKAFYVAQGIDPDRITAIGRGELEPVADNSTPEGQQLNRRVEVVINGFVFSL